MPPIRYSIVSSWLVRPITSASMARQLLSKAAAYSSNVSDSELQAAQSVCHEHRQLYVRRTTLTPSLSPVCLPAVTRGDSHAKTQRR